MSYQIHYPSINREAKSIPSHRRFFMLTSLFFLIFCVASFHFWPEGQNIIKKVLIPGDPDITVPALHSFLTAVSQGESPAEAAKAFCICILEGAGFAAY